VVERCASFVPVWRHEIQSGHKIITSFSPIPSWYPQLNGCSAAAKRYLEVCKLTALVEWNVPDLVSCQNDLMHIQVTVHAGAVQFWSASFKRRFFEFRAGCSREFSKIDSSRVRLSDIVKLHLFSSPRQIHFPAGRLQLKASNRFQCTTVLYSNSFRRKYVRLEVEFVWSSHEVDGKRENCFPNE
jgi:hypothetical protein